MNGLCGNQCPSEKEQQMGNELTLDLGNKITLKLVLIPAGKFLMGSPKDEKLRNDDDETQHEVVITNPFFMGIYAVTQEQYEAVVGKNPSYLKRATNPVGCVSWDDATKFCKKLSQKTEKGVSLPTEAQWEDACRAGTTTPFNTGETISTEQANYDGNSVYGNGQKGTYRKATIAVGSFKPNDFGLFDMHGNVWEWCADWYAKDYYANSPKTDPQGPATGQLHILRGGSWLYDPWNCRSACRFGYGPGTRGVNIGFRVVVAA
jgi:eukaryotic-like serine/threonine-protein kinase